MGECPWSVARLHVRCSNSFSQLESIERERARVCVWAISIHEKPVLALFQMNFDLAGGQPSQGTLVWWAAGHTKGRWQSFRREEGPARGVRYLHSTIWVKCLPIFLQGSFYGCVMCESLLFHICASGLHAVRRVALCMEDFRPVPSGSCCKLKFQHMTSITCLILHLTGWVFEKKQVSLAGTVGLNIIFGTCPKNAISKWQLHLLDLRLHGNVLKQGPEFWHMELVCPSDS